MIYIKLFVMNCRKGHNLDWMKSAVAAGNLCVLCFNYSS